MFSKQQLQEFYNSAKIFKLDKLEEGEAIPLLKNVVSRYVADESSLWMWTSLKMNPVVIPYSGALDWEDKFKKNIKSNGIVYLIITDDEEPPYPVFYGCVENVLNMLKESYGFEYLVVPADLSWVVFDTHMCNFVVANTE